MPFLMRNANLPHTDILYERFKCENSKNSKIYQNTRRHYLLFMFN